MELENIVANTVYLKVSEYSFACIIGKIQHYNCIIHIERIDYSALNINLNRLAKGVQIIVKVAAKNGGSS